MDSSLVEHEIPRPQELFGYSGNRQVNYRSDEFTPCTDPEWIMHIEFDEFKIETLKEINRLELKITKLETEIEHLKK